MNRLELGQPIRNPATGKEHRARIHLPHGLEYEIAEIGSASSRSRGNLIPIERPTWGERWYSPSRSSAAVGW